MPQTPSRTTRMNHGVTNAAQRQTLGNADFPDPTYAVVIALEYINNNDLTAMTLAGGGSLTQSANMLTGAATLASVATAGTTQSAVTPAAFQVIGKRMFIKWAGMVDSLLGTIQIGFFASSTPTSQGVFILSDTSGNLTLNVRNAVGVTSVPFPATCNLVANVAVELGLEIDVQGNCFAYWNPTTGNVNDVGTIGAIASGVVNTGSPDGYVCAAYNQLNGALQNLPLPTALLQAGYAVTPTTAAARSLTSNFFLASQNR